MDKRVILIVLLVTVASVSNAATVASVSNAATVASVSNAATVASTSNAATVASTSNAATVASTSNAAIVASTSNAATVASTSNAATVASANNATTAARASNATTAVLASNATTYAETNTTVIFNSNATNSNATQAPNTSITSFNITTTAASGIIPAIEKSISQKECGSSKHCVDKPSKCDPASGDCHFLSAKKQSDQTYNFELSGHTEGYIAAGLSTDTNLNDSKIAYICANHNGHVRFFTGFFSNLVPNVTNTLNVTVMKGSVNSSKIQCTFTAVLPDTKQRAANYAMGIFTGPYNFSSGELGLPESKAKVTVVDLSNPEANLSGKSASFVYPVTHTHSFLPVLLATMCLLAFTAE